MLARIIGKNLVEKMAKDIPEKVSAIVAKAILESPKESEVITAAHIRAKATKRAAAYKATSGAVIGLGVGISGFFGVKKVVEEAREQIKSKIDETKDSKYIAVSRTLDRSELSERLKLAQKVIKSSEGIDIDKYELEDNIIIETYNSERQKISIPPSLVQR